MDEIPEKHTCSQEEQAPLTTQSRKRQIDSHSDDEPLAKRARLTRKNLALFDKMGKKKAPESSDGSTKTTSTTTSGFADKARGNGILPSCYSKLPTDLEDVRQRHAAPRATASPTESVYEHFANRITKADNEATMVVEVSRHLLKEYDDKGYKRTFNQQFTDFPKNVGFNNGLSAPQPNFIEGLEKEEFYPFPVGKHVDGATLYRDNPYSVTLPHIAGEWKGPDGSMREAELQSSYDGAALTYTRKQALDVMGKPYLAGHAKITTFITDGTNLNLFAHYAAESEDGETEYHQYPISSTNLKNSFEEFKKGRRQLRNAQDLAREESYRLKDELKDYWKHRNNLHVIAEAAPLSAPDYEPPALMGTYEGIQPLPVPGLEPPRAYNDEADYKIVEQPCQPTPAAPTRLHKASPSHSSKSSHNSSNNSHKRKASSSQTSTPGSPGHASKHRSYWKKDPKTGDYYHRHSDGSVSWLDDDNGR